MAIDLIWRGDDMSEFLPVTREEMEAHGWEQADFIYITGDA